MIEHLHRLAAHAYYCGEHEAGRRACERLLRLGMAPEKEERVRANRTYYTEPLRDMGVTLTSERIEIPTRPGWSSFNPCVVKHDGRLLVNVRSSNYTIGPDGAYIIPPEDEGRIRTENWLWWLGSHNGDPVRWDADYKTSGFEIEGLEDVRLNSVDGDLIASATCCDWDGHDGTRRMAVGTLRRVDRIDDLRCHYTVPGRHEKNWMPITGSRKWIYHCHHHGRTCLVREDGDDWTVTAHAESPPVAREFRGGSQLVDVGEGRWLALVHEVATTPKRVYEHRFVEFDETHDWLITRVSMPFVFLETRTIEFAAGLALHNGNLYASVGRNDREAWIFYMPVGEILDRLGDAWA